MTRNMTLVRMGNAAVVIGLLALAPLREVAAGGGNIKISGYLDLDYRVDAVTYGGSRYIGVDNSRNVLWNYSPFDSSQSSCPAPTAGAGLGMPLGGKGGFYYVPELNFSRLWLVNPLTCAGQELAPSYTVNGKFGPMEWGPDKLLWIGVNNYAPSQYAVIRFDPMAQTFQNPYAFDGGPIADLKKFNGNMYATNLGANSIDQITPSWMTTRFKFNGPGYGTLGGWIAPGCGSTLWFTYGYYIGAMTTANKFYFFDAPGSGLAPDAIGLDAYSNVWFSLIGNSYGLSVIDASSIPSDFSHVTFYNYDTGDYQIAGLTKVPFPRVLSPLNRGLDYNAPLPFTCRSPIMGGMIYYRSLVGELASYTGYDQSSCPVETGNRGLISTPNPFIRGLDPTKYF